MFITPRILTWGLRLCTVSLVGLVATVLLAYLEPTLAWLTLGVVTAVLTVGCGLCAYSVGGDLRGRASLPAVSAAVLTAGLLGPHTPPYDVAIALMLTLGTLLTPFLYVGMLMRFSRTLGAAETVGMAGRAYAAPPLSCLGCILLGGALQLLTDSEDLLETFVSLGFAVGAMLGIAYVFILTIRLLMDVPLLEDGKSPSQAPPTKPSTF